MTTILPSIAEAVESIRVGRLRPLDLVERCLGQIEQHEDQVHAWVLVDAEGARRRAEELEKSRAEGEPLSPLFGIPIGVKDIVDVEGMPTKAGSPLREDHLAGADAPLVARLRRAGAIILGKTVTTEFACFDPAATRNPWDFDKTPGGSSSGSAAAVSLGMCMAAIGSQTGGSITRPATYCGVSGLKPTFGGVSTAGIVPVSFHLDHPGPIARTVQDLASVYFSIWSTSEKESLAAHLAAKELFSKIDSDEETPVPYVAVIGEFFMEQAEEPLLSATKTSIDQLRQAGANIGEARLPASFLELHKMHRRIMAVDAAEAHGHFFKESRERLGVHFASLLEEGFACSAVDYARALQHQRLFQQEAMGLFANGNIALTPATSTTAPGHETTGDPKFNSPWSYAGFPTVSIPCAVAADSMPCGLQLIGPPHSESLLLYAAAWCEKRLTFDHTPPLLK